jgi:hypothetical protein
MYRHLKPVFIIFFVFLSGIRINAQDNLELLKKYSDSLRFCKIDSLRFRYNDSFRQLLKTALDEDNAFDIQLDSVSKTVSVMQSADGKMRVISWVYVNDREEYFNHCVVYYRKKQGAKASIFWLQDKMEPKTDSLYTDYSMDFWPGALYYQMYDFRKKGKDYYCVLGLNGLNSFKNRKVIDVLWVDKDGELHIGAPVFYSSEKDYTPQYRVFFDFADASTMFLRFEKDKKMITFSNLVPSNAEKIGMRQYYIPDGRIDYYLLKRKGKWVRYEGLTEFDMIGNH